MTPTALGSTGQAFCRTLLSLDLSSGCFHGYTEVMDFGQSSIKVMMFPFLCIILGTHGVNVIYTLITCLKSCQPAFSIV